MKRFSLLFAALFLLLAGCVSSTLTDYHYATLDDINAKRRANARSQAEIYNRWYYAGSDDHYDYIYEYEKGVSITPPSNFHFYKLDKGVLGADAGMPDRFPFKPDWKSNPEIFSW